MQHQKEHQDLSLSLANRWTRLAGSLIDDCLGLMLIIPFMYFFILDGNLKNAENLNLLQYLMLMLFNWGVFLGFNGYLLAKQGQTIGKRLLKMRIVDLEGNILPLHKLMLMRYFVPGLLNLVPFIGRFYSLADVLAIFNSERRCLHDYIAGTQVVQITKIYE